MRTSDASHALGLDNRCPASSWLKGCDRKLVWLTPECSPNVHESLWSMALIYLLSLMAMDAEEMVSTRPMDPVFLVDAATNRCLPS